MPLLPVGAIAGGRGCNVTATETACPSIFAVIASSDDADGEDSLIREGMERGELVPLFKSGGTFHSTYTLGDKIGEGGFGKVFLARHNLLGVRRAVKRLKKTGVPGQQELLESELRALLALDHPHVVRLVEFYDEEQYLFLIFELCEGPDLFDRATKSPNKRLDEQEASTALRHMLKALQGCHSRYRGHYDIKPENFMYSTADCEDLRMIDLGLSSAFDTHRKRRIKGTPDYMAPEFWVGSYGPEGDIFSCGVVLYVMLTGEQFFPADVPAHIRKREIRVRDVMRKRLKHAADTYALSDTAMRLLEAMLTHDRHGRPTVREALQHPFLSEGLTGEDARQDLSRYPFNEATAIRARLGESFRQVRNEPMLKRVTRLVMAHIGPECIPVRLLFRQLDRHGYGELSISVLENNFAKLGTEVPEDMEELFEAVDLNRDGYIGYLTFLAALLPQQSLSDSTLCKVVFDILDRGGDGSVDGRDLATAFGRDTNDTESAICDKVIVEVVGGEGLMSWEQFANMMGCAIRA